MDESQTEQTEQVESAEQRGPRWFQRVLPVTGLVLAAVALAALALPAFRDQVVLSTTRQPQPFVELYFARQAPDAMCGQGKDGEVRFTVASHLEEQRRLAYRVTVDPAGHGRNGSVSLQPGASRTLRAPVEAPQGGDYTITVELPGRDQQIRAHCSASRT